MYASVILSLGATWPRPPSTCLGTMLNAATPAAVEARNSRRLMSSLGAMGIFSPEEVYGLRGAPVRLPAPKLVRRVSSARTVGRCYLAISAQTWLTPGLADTPPPSGRRTSLTDGHCAAPYQVVAHQFARARLLRWSIGPAAGARRARHPERKQRRESRASDERDAADALQSAEAGECPRGT